MNTQTKQTGFSKILTPVISLTAGGGSIRNTGETFNPNAFSETVSYNIPVPVTLARGFEPQLTLQYNSGTGNGIFGVGFSLPISTVARQTEKGVLNMMILIRIYGMAMNWFLNWLKKTMNGKKKSVQKLTI